MLNNIIKYRISIALGISLLFHISALIGLIFTDNDLFFKNNTPLNLFICLILILLTQSKFNIAFWIFFIVSFISGLVFEITGVNTQMLFGHYQYSNVLGFTIKNVPLFLGFLWFTTMYCVGCLTYQMMNFIILKNDYKVRSFIFKTIFCTVAATLAVLLDYFLEPVAINFNLWNWLPNGDIPIYNYVCWFLCSFVLQILFININISKDNKFASYLYFIQLFFFILLNLFYI